MASQVRVGTFIYRINPNNDKELQRRSYGVNQLEPSDRIQWQSHSGFTAGQ